MSFRWINRHHPSTLVFLPGWAMPTDVFDWDFLPCNLLIPNSDRWDLARQSVADFIARNPEQDIHVLAFSLGCFVLSQWLSQGHLNFKKVCLVGVRHVYPEKDIAAIQHLLHKQPDNFLKSFYQNCLHTPIKQFNPGTIPTSTLLETLSSLTTPISTHHFSVFNELHFYHGQHDQIAPIEESKSLSDLLPRSTFYVVKNCGHFVFYDTEFQQRLANQLSVV